MDRQASNSFKVQLVCLLGRNEVTGHPQKIGVYLLIFADRFDPVDRGDLTVMVDARIVPPTALIKQW